LDKLFRPLTVALMGRLFNSQYFRKLIFDSTNQSLLLTETKEGSIFVVSTRDDVIGRGTFGGAEAWDFDLLVRAIKCIPKSKTPKVLIDVGANIGSIGIAAVKTQMVERAYCIEPDPLNYRLMSAAILLSQVEDKVTPLNMALGDGAETRLQFELSEENFGDHRVRATSNLLELGELATPPTLGVADRFNESDREVIEVPASTLDSLNDKLLKENGEKGVLLFMDTQGYEGHILKGSSRFLQRFDVSVVMEFWPYGLNRSGNGFEFLLEAISRSQLKYFIDLKGNPTPQDATQKNLQILWRKYFPEERHTDIVLF
jgi:FkbM family methyltransferase